MTATTKGRWPELDPLNAPDLPGFPVQALPDVLGEWVAAEAHATQTPADLAGLLALAVHAACIARRVYISPRPGWKEPTNLFAAALLEPASRKSAVFSDATKPLRKLEAAMMQEARPAIARAESERRSLVRRMERCEKKAAAADTEAAAEAAELAAQLANTPEPVLPRWLCDDVTSEKLAMLLAEQDGRIASLSPEGGPFDLMAGRYSKNGTADFTVYLMGHAGDTLRVDRVSRKSVIIERPALTCGFAVQPAVIQGLADNPAFRGRGLLARFLYAAPASHIGRRLIDPAPVPEAVAAAYSAAVLDLAEDPPTGTLTLHGEAARLFTDWQREIEAMLADGGNMEAIRDWGGKLAGLTARLIAVLHCAKHPDPMRRGIDAATVRGAIDIGRYATPHAQTVLQMMAAATDTTDDDARYILRWIGRHERRTFTKRDVYQAGKRRFPRPDDIDPALTELTRRGYIRPTKPEDSGGPGRPPSPAYEVNAAALKTISGSLENVPTIPRNPRNANCGDCGDSFGQSENENRIQVTI